MLRAPYEEFAGHELANGKRGLAPREDPGPETFGGVPLYAKEVEAWQTSNAQNLWMSLGEAA